MKFQPNKPRDEINYTRESPVREIAILVVVASFIAVVVFFVAGQAIELAVPLIPPRWEARVFSGLGSAFPVGGGGVEPSAVEGLVARLEEHWPDCPYEFKLAVEQSGQANAFAVPGGHILLTRGLLEQVESENELAFVLAHEMGHFEGRDHLQSVGRAATFALLRIGVGSLTGMGIPQGVGWAELLTTRGFSRTQESKADEFALGLIHAEYGHLAGAFDFFSRDIDEAEPTVSTWLSTHPMSADRVAALEAVARRRGWNLTGSLVASPYTNNHE